MARYHHNDSLFLEIIFWYIYVDTGSHYYVKQRPFYETLCLAPVALCVFVT